MLDHTNYKMLSAVYIG